MNESKFLKVKTWIVKHYPILITILFLTSEILSEVPEVKANGIFDLVYQFLKKESCEIYCVPSQTTTPLTHE